MRCVICNHCPNTDGGTREMLYIQSENGYVCKHCADSIGESLTDFDIDETEETVDDWPTN